MAMANNSVVRIVQVSDHVYKDLLTRFERNEKNISTGVSNGTNRPVIRLIDGRIVDKNEPHKQIMSRTMLREMCSMMDCATSIPVNSFAKKTHNYDFDPNWIFQEWIYGSESTGNRPRNDI